MPRKAATMRTRITALVLVAVSLTACVGQANPLTLQALQISQAQCARGDSGGCVNTGILQAQAQAEIQASAQAQAQAGIGIISILGLVALGLSR